MAATSQKVTGSAGVMEKVQTPDYSDPQFAIYQGNVNGNTVGQTVDTIAGVSVPLNRRSKEGVTICGGWDPKFMVL